MIVVIGGNILKNAEEWNRSNPIQYAQAEEPPRVILIGTTTPPWTEERIKQRIRDTFPEQPELMIKVAKCESGLKPLAEGPTHDKGIFQIHIPSHKNNLDGVDVFDPADNIAFARKLYDESGTQPWNASRKCWQS